VILAIDGMQPDVGHEVLWVIRGAFLERFYWQNFLIGNTEDLGVLLKVVKAL